MVSLADENLQNTFMSKKYKHYYIPKSKQRNLKVGDKVLVLLSKKGQ